MRATGPFEVKLDPQPAYNADPASLLGRMSLDKQFHLAGTMSIEIVDGKHAYVLEYSLPGIA